VTTGCLTERILQNEDSVGKFTHIIMDEVHERDVENDLLLNLMRRMLTLHKSLKLILMSATIDPDKFSNYFRGVVKS
jgi:HrpA-like RNA helicase